MLNIIPKSIHTHSRGIEASNIASYGSDLIQWNDNTSIELKHSRNDTPQANQQIRTLIENGILQESSTQKLPKTKFFTDSDYQSLLLCNITVNSIIMPHKSWSFAFDLWIRNRRRWYFHTFKMNRDQLKKLDVNIKFHENNSNKGQSVLFFPEQNYPKSPKGTEEARTEETKKYIKKESSYLRKPILPKITWGIVKKSANMQHAICYAEYLQNCFSSLSLSTKDWFYTLLGSGNGYGLNKELAQYIKTISAKKLKIMLQKTEEKNCSIKRLSRRNEFKFHTCYVASRPLHDPTTEIFNFNHWALKFEGESSLLTIEFFAAQKGVKIRQLMNSSLSRRIFWYWWDPDPVKEHADETGLGLLYFTRRWKVIERFAFEKDKYITAPLLSFIVEKWLLTGQNKKYHVLKNNCQHFCRDIVSVLDRNVALSLNSFLDHTTLTNLIPVVAIGDGLAEHARTLEISKQLGDALKEYKIREKQRRKMQKERHNLGQARMRLSKSSTMNSMMSISATFDIVDDEKEYIQIDHKMWNENDLNEKENENEIGNQNQKQIDVQNVDVLQKNSE